MLTSFSTSLCGSIGDFLSCIGFFRAKFNFYFEFTNDLVDYSRDLVLELVGLFLSSFD